MDDFLKTEYEQSLSLIKYYDDKHNSLVMFAASLSSAVPSLMLAIYQLAGDVANYFWHFALIISIITAIGLLSIYTVLTQTRLYFIYPARQANAIRKHSIERLNDNSFENQMFLSTSFNAFKWTSTQTILNFFVALQVAAFTGLAAFSYQQVYHQDKFSLWLPLSIGFTTLFIIFTVSSRYLHSESKYHPDQSIHKEKKTK